MDKKEIKTNPFKEGDVHVTSVGLGGEGVLRTTGYYTKAAEVILEAERQGVTYFDSARAYSDSELYYGSVWQKYPEKRIRIFQASKSASRDRDGALSDLSRTLQRMQTDFLDLWQIHDVRTEEDLETISKPGGALEAFIEAKSSGRVRYIGVTGHHDPRILTVAVRDWPVDTVMMPVNPVEGLLGGFLTSTLPAAKEKGMAVIGMKVLGASHYVRPELGITSEMLIRYALSFGITVAIVGCSTPEEVNTLADVGRLKEPMRDREKARINDIFSPYVHRLAFYRG
ncbi:MAG: aldo/keto reductase [Thermodesulfobacteriota bacterium]|nr:aldo/keto reductase [Thermodesulfobacteriota bacterium]